MPDAGDFEKRDASASPASWGDAFAALPQQAPDAGGWQRLQTRLPAASSPRMRRRWPAWLAAAASLGLVVALPLRMLPQSSTDEAAPLMQAPVAATSTPAIHAAMPEVAAPAVVADTIPESIPATGRASSRRATPIAPSHRPVRTIAEPADATRIAASMSTNADLEPLYARSAQLESLLALARDERVASGPSAALSNELDARVLAIDATLVQAGLSDSQRTDLWDQRVDALQQLVGIEATNRLYAARGQQYEAALVSID